MADRTKYTEKICKILTIVWSSLLAASVFPLMIWMLLYAPDLNSVPYFSDPANYLSFEGSVRSFSLVEDAIYLTVDHAREEFYEDFRIDGKNFDLALENGLPDLLQKGASFTITAASAYVGDGWAYPIAALTCEGREIGPFEEGRKNCVEVQQNAENFARSYILKFAIAVGILAVFDACSVIGFFTAKGSEDGKCPINEKSEGR